jgi:hypothetical protein
MYGEGYHHGTIHEEYHGLTFHSSLCFLFPYFCFYLPCLFVLFNPCMQWHLVPLHICLAICLAVSHLCCNIVEGF